MRIRPHRILVLASLLAPSALGFAAEHGGPTFDPSTDFDSAVSADSLEAREQSLVPLDLLIPPESQARLDDQRPDNAAFAATLAERTGFSHGGVDLRACDTEVKKQFGGTCTAFGLMAAMENWVGCHGGRVDLSERHFWSEYHQYSADVALETATTSWGVVDLAWWPDSHSHPYYGYVDQPWYKLTKYTDLGGSIAKAIAALNARTPLYVAVSTPKDMVENEPARVDPSSGPYPNSGHALAIVGYQLDPVTPGAGGGWFLMKNSWGTACGEKGYEWYPFDLCTKAGMYCEFWAIQGVTHD